MGTDDTDDKRKGEAGRETFETVPPELRPFYVPGPDDSIDLSKNPRLAAARAGLEMLDRIEEAERRAAAAQGGAKAHVAPVSIPQPARPRSEPPAARVEVSMPVLVLPESKPLAERQLIQVEKKGGRAEDDEPTPNKDKPAASPWAKSPQGDEVRASALPSSLRPRGLPAAESDAPASSRPTSERPAGVPVGGHGKTAAIGIAILVVALVIGVRAFMTERTPENGSHGPAPRATMTATLPTATAVPMPMPTPPASAEEHAPKAASGTSSAAPAASSTPAPVIAPRPKPRGALDDPYGDASAPSPTTAPSTTAPVPTPTVAPTVAPKAPPSAATSEKPIYD